MSQHFQDYVLSEERARLQDEALLLAAELLQGPVVFYQERPGKGPELLFSVDSAAPWPEYCRVLRTAPFSELCLKDCERRAANCSQPEMQLCWAGVHTVTVPVDDLYDRAVLIGGTFRLQTEAAEAEALRDRLLAQLPVGHREALSTAWAEIPMLTEEQARIRFVTVLRQVALFYLASLRQRGELRVVLETTIHDMSIVIQQIIADVEILKMDLMRSTGLAQKWQNRFEDVLELCEKQAKSLEKDISAQAYDLRYESLSQLIYSTVTDFCAAAAKRAIEFKIDLEQMQGEDGQPSGPAVRVDREVLGKAFSNLIENAIKYSFAGTIHSVRWVEVIGRLKSFGGTAGYELQFRNLGVGVDEDEVQLVFAAGYRGRRSLCEDRTGKGMGLNYVKNCVERHGGSVSIASQPSQGTAWLTTVTVWLPIHGPADSSINRG